MENQNTESWRHAEGRVATGCPSVRDSESWLHCLLYSTEACQSPETTQSQVLVIGNTQTCETRSRLQNFGILFIMEFLTLSFFFNSVLQYYFYYLCDCWVYLVPLHFAVEAVPHSFPSPSPACLYLVPELQCISS